MYLAALPTALRPAQCCHDDETCWETGASEGMSLPKAEGLHQELMTPGELHHQLLQQ